MTGLRKCVSSFSAILLFGCFSFGQSHNAAKNETIAYEHGLDDPSHNILLDLDIYSVNANGGNVKALTHDAQNNHLPTWSHDGRSWASSPLTPLTWQPRRRGFNILLHRKPRCSGKNPATSRTNESAGCACFSGSPPSVWPASLRIQPRGQP